MCARFVARLALGLVFLFAVPLSAPAQGPASVTVPVGAAPAGVAVDTIRNVALVSNFQGNDLSVVDLSPANLQDVRVVATVLNVPTPAGVAFNPVTGQAVVASRFNNQVTVLAPVSVAGVPTFLAFDVVSVGSTPVGVAIDTASNIALVVNSNGSSISLVELNPDGNANTPDARLLDTISGISNATGIQSIAADADLGIAAVASTTANSVFLIDLTPLRAQPRRTDLPVIQVPVEQFPVSAAIERAGRTIVVANLQSNSVSLIDLTQLPPFTTPTPFTVRAPIPSVPQPQAAAISPNTRSALVTTGSNATLEVLSVSAASVENTIQNLPNAAAVAFHTGAGRAVVVLPTSNSVAVLDSLGVFSIVNSASFEIGAVGVKSIVAGFGSNLTANTVSANTVPLPTTLDGVQVFVNNVASPLFFVSPTQVNFQTPLAVTGTFPVRVTRQGVQVASGVLPVAQAAPALFTLNTQGTGQIAALNQDLTPNGPLVTDPVFPNQRPAARGNVVALFATGGGLTNPEPPAGEPVAPGVLAPTVATPVVLIGGVQAAIHFSGAAPGLVGVWQINAFVPEGIQPGDAVPVVVTQGGRTSNTGTIAVQ